jgi:hypothetical protein
MVSHLARFLEDLHDISDGRSRGVVEQSGSPQF